ncbi:MAG: 2-amino-4-hydroxy-6-hydroxymethyldihydropteridine diphosphokinase [Mycolicibacterium sp.]|uniref:2-amino-4-hydroxy-6- hydroxymethyldihydropteridine diphosphokinase n=1 Tax=Mycolicibacterium sp. TaxID=2320850 RepID=UPI003D0A39EA
MTSAVLSIGSNVGDRLAWLQAAVDGLGSAQGSVVRAVSPLYETDPWGGVEQGLFLNAVVRVDDPAMNAHGWLRLAQRLENAAGRIRDQRWGPRTLDVDIITCHDSFGEVTVQDEVLTLPHPYAHLRAFVLVPWLAIEPEATLSVAGRERAAADLLDGLGPAERSAVRLTELTLRMPDELSS